MPQNYAFGIVGAGHNSLSAAGYLTMQADYRAGPCLRHHRTRLKPRLSYINRLLNLPLVRRRARGNYHNGHHGLAGSIADAPQFVRWHLSMHSYFFPS